MSELKAFNSERIYWAVEQVEREAGDIDTLHLDDNLFYVKSEVDAAIAELKEVYKDSVDVKVKIWERCKKSEDELRKTQRALWLARAERALSEQHVISNAVLYLENKFNHKFNAVRYELHVWGVVKRKCRAKAEEYK